MVKPQVMIGVLLLFLAVIYMVAARKWIYLLFLVTGCMGVVAEVALLLYKRQVTRKGFAEFDVNCGSVDFGICVQVFYTSKTENGNKRMLDIIWYSLTVLSCLVVFAGWLFPAIEEKQVEYAERYAKSELVNEYCLGHSENILFFTL